MYHIELDSLQIPAGFRIYSIEVFQVCSVDPSWTAAELFVVLDQTTLVPFIPTSASIDKRTMR